MDKDGKSWSQRRLANAPGIESNQAVWNLENRDTELGMERRQDHLQHTHSLRIRLLIILVLLLLLFLLVGTILSILSITNFIHAPWSNSFSAILLTIIVPIIGTAVPLLQWLFSLDEKKPTLSHNTPTTLQTSGIVINVHTSPSDLKKNHSISPFHADTSNNIGETPIQIVTNANADDSIQAHETFHHIDWGEAPAIEHLYGREKELTVLTKWVVSDHCRIVAVFGMGGIGKTALSSKLVEQVKGDFAYIFWRSLQNTPPLSDLLKICIQFISGQKQVNIPNDPNSQVTLLIEYMKQHKCLFVLDNVESVMQGGMGTGHYRGGYEGYGTLIHRIGEAKHQSCLLLNSRQKPRELVHLEGDTAPVRSLSLSGLEHLEGMKMLQDKGLFGTNDEWERLIGLYSGNPLALKLISATIREVLGGNIAAFLKKGEIAFGDIHNLLDQQFLPLSVLEKEVMYWLAIEREGISLDELETDLAEPVRYNKLLEGIQSLLRRSMIETGTSAHFYLQPVILEYVTNSFVELMYEAFSTENMGIFGSYALIKAQAKDYVRNSQIRVLLTPIAERLVKTIGMQDTEQRLKDMLPILRKSGTQHPVYAAGNVLNLLVHLQRDLSSCNFSALIVRQAYLQGVALPNVSFAHAMLEHSVFTETFGSILSIARSSDGALLAAGTATGEVWVWHLVKNTLLRIYKGHTDWVWSVAFSPDGQTLASGSEDQTIRLWGLSTGQCIKALPSSGSRVWSVVFSSDGNVLASSEEQIIRLWDTHSYQHWGTLRGHRGQVYAAAISPDGNLLASGGEDHVIQLWDLHTQQNIKSLKGHDGWIRSLVFSSDNRILASGSEDQTARLWEVNLDQPLKRVLEHNSRVYAVAFSPDINTLISGSEDGIMRLWNVHTGDCLKILQEHTNRIWSIAFNSDGKTIFSGSEDQTVRIWETDTGQGLRTLQGYANSVWSIAFSPAETLLASGSEDQMVRLWDSNTGNCIRTLHGHTNWVRSVAFSPDGNTLASGSEDQSIRIWNVHTGQCIKTLHGHTGWVRSIAFDPEGRVLASGSEDQTVRLWNVSTGECLKVLSDGNRVWSVFFSPNGEMLASGEEQTVCLWNVGTACRNELLEGHSGWVRSVAFSPDGQILASGGEDRTVRLWNTKKVECLKILQGHMNSIRSIAFSPDGQILASSSEDQTLRLWSTHTGECLKILQEQAGQVWSVSFSIDGSIVAGSSNNGTITMWHVRTGDVFNILRCERPYEGMNITGIKGLTEAQKISLKTLGAVEMTTASELF